MKVRTYRADKLPTAFALVKRDLGPKAVILHTRTYKHGGLLGVGGRTVVEITAAAEEDVGRRPPRRPDRQVAVPAAQRGSLLAQTYGVAPGAVATAQVPSPPAIERPGAVGQATGGPAAPAADDVGRLAHEMGAVKQMVRQLMKNQAGQATTRLEKSDMPENLFRHYLRLLEQQVAEELAGRIIEQVRTGLSETQLQDQAAVAAAVRDQIALLLPGDEHADRLPDAPQGRPRTIAFIGPTGVGKTTTIAKLAAIFKLQQKKQVGLITVDTYRIAAVEQLRTYADIMDVPLHVVQETDQLASAMRKCAGCDVVLIDTAGRSQRDPQKLDQLEQFIRVADPHEVHLVLASTCDEAAMLDVVERFSRIRVDRIAFTKLDEAVTLGVLVNVASKVNKRLSFVTMGQDVPHDIEPSRPQRIADFVMGKVGG